MDTITQTLIIYADMVGGIRVKAGAYVLQREGFTTATDLADYRVRGACRSVTRMGAWRERSRPPK